LNGKNNDGQDETKNPAQNKKNVMPMDRPSAVPCFFKNQHVLQTKNHNRHEFVCPRCMMANNNRVDTPFKSQKPKPGHLKKIGTTQNDKSAVRDKQKKRSHTTNGGRTKNSNQQNPTAQLKIAKLQIRATTQKQNSPLLQKFTTKTFQL